MSTITVTTSQLQSICLTDTGKAAVGTEAYTTAINTAMANWLINTPERAALFLAQVTYETAEFQRFVETGSDTYRRRGALPIHGDSEFKGLGKTVVQDLLTHPAYVSLPGFAFEAAGWLWERDGHNVSADDGDLLGSTRLLTANGNSYAGLDITARTAYYNAAIDALGDFVIQHPLDGDPVAGNTGSSTTDGYLRWLRDWYYANFGAKNDVVAPDDDGSYSIFSRIKRLSWSISSLLSVFTNSTSSAVLSAAGQELIIPVGNRGAVGLQIRGTNVGGVVTFYASQDGADYIAINATPISSGGDNNPTSTASSAGNYAIIGGGFTHVKASLTTAGSGSFTVSSVATPSHRNIGVPAIGSALDSAAASDTATSSLIGLIRRLLLKTPSAVAATATISSAYVSGAAQVQAAVQDGHNTFSANIVPSSFTGTLLFVYSRDGITWYPLFTQRTDSFGNMPASSAAFSASSATMDVRGIIPAGAAYIGVNCSPYTSGSAAVTVTASAASTSQIVTTQSQLLAGVARIGFIACAGIAYNDSITPVNANQTITSAAKSTYNTSSATAWNAASSYGNRFRAAAGADVVGTLIAEYSNNATDWYPVSNGSATMIQNGGAGNFGASLDLPCVGVYMRAKLINGASNQTKVYLTTNLLG